MRILLLSTIVLTAVLTSCGEEDCPKNEDCSEEAVAEEPKDFNILGAVSGAFSVKVDGKNYDDIEAFYTAEVKRLPKKLADAGYEGWSWSLDGELGLSDLAYEMLVFIAPKKSRGYASQMYTLDDGTFIFEFPSEAAGDTYQLKAVKRLNLTVKAPLASGEGASKVFCYNFAAVEKSVKYDEVGKPIVLDTFETSITEYECESSEENGLIIPE